MALTNRGRAACSALGFFAMHYTTASGPRRPLATNEVVAPRLDDAALPIEKAMRWRIAGIIAGYSANPQRTADLEAYEVRNVPAESRKPFLEAAASIQENQRIAKNVLPQIDAWIAARNPKPPARTVVVE